MTKRQRETRPPQTLSSQGTGGILNISNSALTKPYFWFNINRKVNPAATIFMMYGMKSRVRKNRKPRTRLEFRITAKTNAKNVIIGTYRKNKITPFVMDCQNTLSFSNSSKFRNATNLIGPSPFHSVKLKYKEKRIG